MSDVGYRMSDIGCRMSDVEDWRKLPNTQPLKPNPFILHGTHSYFNT